MVQFKEGKSKGAIYSNVKKLAKLPNWGGISVGDDMTPTEQDHQRDIGIVAAHAKTKEKKVDLKGKTVKIDDIAYVWDNPGAAP